jgi:hypothetical protein
MTIVIKKIANIPTEVGNIRNEMKKQMTETTPPNKNIVQGLLIAAFIDTSFSKTKKTT